MNLDTLLIVCPSAESAEQWKDAGREAELSVRLLPAGDIPFEGIETGRGTALLIDYTAPSAGWQDHVLSLLDSFESSIPVVVIYNEKEDLNQLFSRDENWTNRFTGIFHSDTGLEKLAAALKAVSRGYAVYEPEVLERVNAAPAAASDLPVLTEKETEVLLRVAKGMPSKAVGVEMGITERTVKFHLDNVMRKLDAQSRTEAVTIALRKGIIPL